MDRNNRRKKKKILSLLSQEVISVDAYLNM